MERSTKLRESAAPPTSTGTFTPARERSSAVATIWCALFTSRPESPRMSGRCSRTAATSCSGGTLMPRFTTWKPLLARMISTRFLPMSWTSPFTVARTTLPRTRGGVLVHVRLEVADRRLHHLGALQHLGDDELVLAEEPAHLVHAGHQRAVDDLQRLLRLERQVEVLEEPVPAALDDVAREPLVEGQRARGPRRRLALAEVRREGGDRVRAPVEEQVLARASAPPRGARGSARASRS